MDRAAEAVFVNGHIVILLRCQHLLHLLQWTRVLVLKTLRQI